MLSQRLGLLEDFLHGDDVRWLAATVGASPTARNAAIGAA
jgi:hypothetical protein